MAFLVALLASSSVLWAVAFWRIIIRGEHRTETFDECLALKFRIWLSGIALISMWIGLFMSWFPKVMVRAT